MEERPETEPHLLFVVYFLIIELFFFIPSLSLKLMEQIKVLEQSVSQQSGEKEELIGHLNQIKENHTSASQNTESMVGKIQVSEKV